MKEDYFTKDSLATTASQLLNEIAPFYRKRKWTIQNDSVALLVLDMQCYFLERVSHAFIPSAEAIVPNIKKLQECFLERGGRVFQTRHVNTMENAGGMNRWWRELLTASNGLCEVIGDITDDRVKCLDKSQYDAFFKTNLETELKTLGIHQVVITGVMTHLCCESTARSAFMRGFEVFFVVDATATYNLQFHRASLLTLSHGFVVPVLTGEIVGGKND